MITFKNTLLLATAASAALTYCSPQNSGESFDSVFGQFQSNGACSDTCAGYAFAILQGQKCWCSNTAPSDTTSVGKCDEACAGYPTDKCGNMFDGLFGYIQLGQASGTMSESTSAKSTSSSTSSSSSSSSSSPTTSSMSPTTSSVSPTTSSVSPTTSSESPTTSSMSSTESPTTSSMSSTTESSSTSDSSSSTSSTSATPSISVLTVVGGEKTVTVSNSSPTTSPVSPTTSPMSQSSPAPTFDPQSKHKDDDGFFSHKGKVAGVFTVVGLVAAALIAALVFFLVRRSRKNKYDDDDDDDDDELTVGSGGSPTGSPWRSKSAAAAAAVGVVGRSQSTRTTLGGNDRGYVGGGNPGGYSGGYSGGNHLGTSPSQATSGKLRIDESSESGSHHMMREQSESSILGSMAMHDSATPAESSTPGRSMAANMSQVHEVPVVDQRLDPSQMVLRYDGVDESRHSLQDDADYSRRILRVTNPDYFG